jgi:N12 class adenine-specific DNA methylase
MPIDADTIEAKLTEFIEKRAKQLNMTTEEYLKSKIRELKEKEIREDSLSRDQLERIANDLHMSGRRPRT